MSSKPAAASFWSAGQFNANGLVARLFELFWKSLKGRPALTDAAAVATAARSAHKPTTAAASASSSSRRGAQRGRGQKQQPPQPPPPPPQGQPRYVTVKGLSNLGNTCFLNSLLQSLATLPPFIHALEQAVPPPGAAPLRPPSRARKATAAAAAATAAASRSWAGLLQLQPPPPEEAEEDSREPGRLSQLVLNVLHELEPQISYGPPSSSKSPSSSSSSSSSGAAALPFRPSRPPYDPSALNSEVHRRCRLLQRYEQQDAEELLQLLVSLIDDDLKPLPATSPATTTTATMAKAKPPVASGGLRAVLLGTAGGRGGGGAAAGLPGRWTAASSSSSSLGKLVLDEVEEKRATEGTNGQANGHGQGNNGSSIISSNGHHAPEAATAHTNGGSSISSSTSTSNAPLSSSLPPPAAAAATSSSTPCTLSPPPRFQNPLAGWLASTLTCCRCGHRRPVHNTEFIDVALPLPDTAAVLGGGAVRLGLANGSARGAAGRPCHLMECLAEYAAEELLQGVECWGCVRVGKVAALDAEAARLEGMIRNVEALDDGLGDDLLPGYEAALDKARRKRMQLQELNPDNPASLPLLAEFAAVAAAASSSGGAREKGKASKAKAVEAARSPAIKRMVFSRLPPVLCLHIGRRVFSPSLGRMAKVRQQLIFPMLMDMARFAAYGGQMSNDVADVAHAHARPAGAAASSSLAAADSDSLNDDDPTEPPPRQQEQEQEQEQEAGDAIPHQSVSDSSSMVPSSSSSSKSKYLLQAVVVHHGSADGGHYTTYRRVSRVSPRHAAALLGQAQAHQHHQQQQQAAAGGAASGNGGVASLARGLLAPEINTWVHVSDDCVAAASVEEVLACEAYMLFYQSLESIIRDAAQQGEDDEVEATEQ